MNDLTRLLGCLGLFSVIACSSGASGRLAAASPPMPVASVTRTAESADALTLKDETTRAAPLEYHDETEADRVFIENAERAIREYSAFLARAGDSPEYAQAVKRSREQIHDLQDALIFVREGAAHRAAH